MAALALLDCSAGFDTVDHDILLRKLSESFNVGGIVLQYTEYFQLAFGIICLPTYTNQAATISDLAGCHIVLRVGWRHK
jgi:hypothetical protein